MSYEVFSERMQSITTRSKALKQQIVKAEKALIKTPALDASALAEGALQVLDNLSFDEKKNVVRKLVTSVKGNSKGSDHMRSNTGYFRFKGWFAC